MIEAPEGDVLRITHICHAIGEAGHPALEELGVRWEPLLLAAWASRENAHVVGPTRVGAACSATSGRIYAGCNVEHRYRSHDVHAEVNAITNMVALGEKDLLAIAIVAERDRFTPCGACLDWIFQFGGGACVVAWQTRDRSVLTVTHAADLMPYYPT
jgi:cytidine deaminase